MVLTCNAAFGCTLAADLGLDPTESLDDYVGPENPVRFIEAFVDGLDLAGRDVMGPRLIAFDLAGVAEGVGRADADAAAMTMTTPFFRRLCR